ncbi:MAG: translation elongation factor-like protein [Promethearchaeota archaeon]
MSEKESEKVLIGTVANFYSHISVAVVKLSSKIRVGDMILIEGTTTNFEQKVDSMQIEHKSISEAKAGQSIGLKVIDRVRIGDKVYLSG